MDLSLLPKGLTHGKEPLPGKDEDMASSHLLPSPAKWHGQREDRNRHSPSHVQADGTFCPEAHQLACVPCSSRLTAVRSERASVRSGLSHQRAPREGPGHRAIPTMTRQEPTASEPSLGARPCAKRDASCGLSPLILSLALW